MRGPGGPKWGAPKSPFGKRARGVFPRRLSRPRRRDGAGRARIARPGETNVIKRKVLKV